MKYHNNFGKNLTHAQKAECAVGKILEKQLHHKVLQYNNDYKYDILTENAKGIKLTFEVKEDDRCATTGNVVVEYESRGKPSGISTSKADFWIFRVHHGNKIHNLLFATENLKKLIAKGIHYNRKMTTTDSSNRLHFFKFNDIFSAADRTYYD